MLHFSPGRASTYIICPVYTYNLNPWFAGLGTTEPADTTSSFLCQPRLQRKLRQSPSSLGPSPLRCVAGGEEKTIRKTMPNAAGPCVTEKPNCPGTRKLRNPL